MKLCDILIISDNEDNLKIISEAFLASGVRCLQNVNTAMQAFMYLQLIQYEEDFPKLIVTDLYIPGMTGAEFAVDLKTMPIYRHIPVIVLSAIKSQYEINKYREMGIEEYLIKPTTYSQYIEVANKIRDKYLSQ